MSERVAVVIPYHDRPHLLHRAIDSVLAQERGAAEIVVVDDSPEGLDPALLDRYRERGVHFVRSSFRHACKSRNLGARSTSSDWLGFLDHDDWVEPQWLSGLLAAPRDGSGRTAMTFCGARYRDESGRAVSAHLPSPLGPAYASQTALFFAGAFLVRSDLFWEAGGYDEELPSGQQSELGIRASRVLRERGWSTSFTREILVNLESRPKGQRALRRDDSVAAACERILARHDAVLRHDPSALALLHRTAARCYARVGDLGAAVAHWWRGFRAQPLHRSNLTFVVYFARLRVLRFRQLLVRGLAGKS
jgi:glycosyltransferase involved in cell wall biosynthesis